MTIFHRCKRNADMKDEAMKNLVIRFNSLCMGEALGRLSAEERIELDKLSVIDMLHPGKPREMLGMRRANFL